MPGQQHPADPPENGEEKNPPENGEERNPEEENTEIFKKTLTEVKVVFLNSPKQIFPSFMDCLAAIAILRTSIPSCNEVRG